MNFLTFCSRCNCAPSDCACVRTLAKHTPRASSKASVEALQVQRTMEELEQIRDGLTLTSRERMTFNRVLNILSRVRAHTLADNEATYPGGPSGKSNPLSLEEAKEMLAPYTRYATRGSDLGDTEYYWVQDSGAVLATGYHSSHHSRSHVRIVNMYNFEGEEAEELLKCGLPKGG